MNTVQIPTKEELKNLCKIEKHKALEKIVSQMKFEASRGSKTAYVNFKPEEGMTEIIREEIRDELRLAGYSVSVFEDTSYRNEGTSFTIILF